MRVGNPRFCRPIDGTWLGSGLDQEILPRRDAGTMNMRCD